MRETRGRCGQCKTIYQWRGGPKLMHAHCGRCGVPLERCKTLDVGQKLFQQPAASA